MSAVEVFLDETPGETRGVIAREGRFEHLFIQRDDDPPQHRLGARSVGRVVRIERGLKAAFVDLGSEGPAGFLPLSGSVKLVEGARVEVVVSAEARDEKGPVLKLIGPATGESGLVAAGPDVRAILADLAPGHVAVTGAPAIQAALDAEEEALSTGVVLQDLGLDLKLERTRALIAVDFDWSAAAGNSGRSARDRANACGLAEAARLIRLKSWGGLVAVDLIGSGFDGESIAGSARRAFVADPQMVLGPVNRFGVLMLSLPWRREPIELRCGGTGVAETLRHRAQAAVRGLNQALLSNRAAPTLTLICAPDEAARAEAWVRQLGPRARLAGDPAIGPGAYVLEEG